VKGGRGVVIGWEHQKRKREKKRVHISAQIKGIWEWGKKKKGDIREGGKR